MGMTRLRHLLRHCPKSWHLLRLTIQPKILMMSLLRLSVAIVLEANPWTEEGVEADLVQGLNHDLGRLVDRNQVVDLSQGLDLGQGQSHDLGQSLNLNLAQYRGLDQSQDPDLYLGQEVGLDLDLAVMWKVKRKKLLKKHLERIRMMNVRLFLLFLLSLTVKAKET